MSGSEHYDEHGNIKNINSEMSPKAAQHIQEEFITNDLILELLVNPAHNFGKKAKRFVKRYFSGIGFLPSSAINSQNDESCQDCDCHSQPKPLTDQNTVMQEFLVTFTQGVEVLGTQTYLLDVPEYSSYTECGDIDYSTHSSVTINQSCQSSDVHTVTIDICSEEGVCETNECGNLPFELDPDNDSDIVTSLKLVAGFMTGQTPLLQIEKVVANNNNDDIPDVPDEGPYDPETRQSIFDMWTDDEGEGDGIGRVQFTRGGEIVEEGAPWYNSFNSWKRSSNPSSDKRSGAYGVLSNRPGSAEFDKDTRYAKATISRYCEFPYVSAVSQYSFIYDKEMVEGGMTIHDQLTHVASSAGADKIHFNPVSYDHLQNTWNGVRDDAYGLKVESIDDDISPTYRGASVSLSKDEPDGAFGGFHFYGDEKRAKLYVLPVEGSPTLQEGKSYYFVPECVDFHNEDDKWSFQDKFNKPFDAAMVFDAKVDNGHVYLSMREPIEGSIADEENYSVLTNRLNDEFVLTGDWFESLNTWQGEVTVSDSWVGTALPSFTRVPGTSVGLGRFYSETELEALRFQEGVTQQDVEEHMALTGVDRFTNSKVIVHGRQGKEFSRAADASIMYDDAVDADGNALGDGGPLTEKFGNFSVDVTWTHAFEGYPVSAELGWYHHVLERSANFSALECD